MKSIITLSVDNDLLYNERFVELKKNKQLSTVFNQFLKEYLNFENSVNVNLADLEIELLKIDSKKAELLDLKKKLEEEAKKRAENEKIIDSW